MAKDDKTTMKAADDQLHGFNPAEFTEEEQLGFPAYFKPKWDAEKKIGSKFVATVIQLDDSGDFERWIFQAEHPIECQRGPVNDAEKVLVKKGDFFSTSALAQFGDSTSGRGLHQYVGERVMLEVVGTRKTDQPAPMFVFKLTVTAETKARLLAARRARVSGTPALPAAAHPVAAIPDGARPA